MSVDLEKATTRNLLDGLRSYITTFDSQLDHAHRQDALAVTESAEHSARATYFSDVLPRLQTYGFVTLLAVIVEARLAVFCHVLQKEYAVPFDEESGDGFLHRVHNTVTRYLGAQPPEDLWRWTTDVAFVRDCISRHAGSASALSTADRHELNRISRRRPGLEVVDDDRLFTTLPHPSNNVERVVAVRREFCLEAVTAAQGLFGYLYPLREPAGR